MKNTDDEMKTNWLILRVKYLKRFSQIPKMPIFFSANFAPKRFRSVIQKV